MENNSQIQIKFHWIYLIGIFLILALPLLAVAPLFHPPAWAKAVVFRIIFSILIFIFVYQLLYRKYDVDFIGKIKNILNRKSNIFWPFWLLIAYLAVFFLATIFSLEPFFSVWGSPSRGGGFLNLALVILFAIFAFLILKTKDWKKIWNFVFIVGIIVSLLAIFQKFNLLGDFILAYSWRPVSTMGGPMFLALFLVLLTFLPLSFAVINKGKKRFFYLVSSLLFIFVIILTATRSAFLGLTVGFLFFIFLYPNQNKLKIIKRLKVLLGILLFLGVVTAFVLNSQPGVLQKLTKEDTAFGPAFSRIWPMVKDFSIEKILSSRGSGWKLGIGALKDRPILGYGPENFSIAFDRYYDPTLPGIVKEPGEAGSTGWWDKGHNFMLDIAVTAGIPALIIYLLLFGLLFYKLQRIKQKEPNLNRNKILIAHGIQATFIGYLITNFFNFDVFSTYLISFLLIGYSLFLINKNNQSSIKEIVIKPLFNISWRKPLLLSALFVFLIFFIYNYNLKPLLINKELNIVYLLISTSRTDKNIEKKRELALQKIDKIYLSSNILDNYLGLNYIDVIASCYGIFPERKIQLSYKAIEILDEIKKSRPHYTRTWLFDGIYTYNILRDDKNLNLKTKEELIQRAYSSFEKAHQLSLKRQNIYVGLVKLDLLLERYKDAEKRVEECININDEFGDCWWAKALVYINSGQVEKGTEAIETAIEKGYNVVEKSILGQLINIYGELAKKTDDLHYYQVLSYLYEKSIILKPKDFQNHASLAYIYRKLERYDEARKETMIVLELSPESKQSVEEFLKTLPAK